MTDVVVGSGVHIKRWDQIIVWRILFSLSLALGGVGILAAWRSSSSSGLRDINVVVGSNVHIIWWRIIFSRTFFSLSLALAGVPVLAAWRPSSSSEVRDISFHVNWSLSIEVGMYSFHGPSNGCLDMGNL